MVGADASSEETDKDYGDIMKRLLQPLQQVQKHDSQIIQVRGINRTDNYADGSLETSSHLCLDRFPYFSSWAPWLQMDGVENAQAVSSWDDLIYIDGRTMYIGQDEVGYTFLRGQKQFAMMQNKLIVWPDKVYVNMQTLDVVPLAENVVASTASFGEHTLTLNTLGGIDLTLHFHPDDTIKISNLEGEYAANNGWWRVESVAKRTITFSMAEEQTFVTGEPEVKPVVERVIPNLAYITVQNNRLWGVDNEEQAIWSSVQGDPTNFYTNKGIASDANAIPVSSGGDFTGIATLGTQVLAWKNDTLYKVLGLYPEEYHTYTYHIEGVAPGCAKSMVIINDALYYMSSHGVMVYSGTQAVPISQALGQRGYEEAVAGTDGDRYYLSVKDGNVYRLYVYDIRTGIWLEESNEQVIDFARSGDSCYAVTADGNLYQERAGDKNSTAITWNMTFNTFREASTGSDRKSMTAYVLKRYHRLIFRVDVPTGSTMKIELAYDDGPWQTVANITGKKGIVSYPVPIAKCDAFRLRMSGTGPFALLQAVREFSLGTTR